MLERDSWGTIKDITFEAQQVTNLQSCSEVVRLLSSTGHNSKDVDQLEIPRANKNHQML